MLQDLAYYESMITLTNLVTTTLSSQITNNIKKK